MDESAGSGQPLDTIVVVSTPENVAFEFRLAGPFSRFFAVVIDLVLLVLVLVVLGWLLLMVAGESGVGIALAVAFFGWWGYGSLMEAFFNGQTLGKRSLGIRVVTTEGLAINPGQAFLRTMIRGVDLLPPFFPGVFAMLMSTNFQRLGDLAAQTIVVMDGSALAPRPPEAPHGTDVLRDLIPARFRAERALVEALAGYLGRRGDLSVGRRRELAAPLAGHFVRVWNLPLNTDPDMLLCAIYDRATRENLPQTEAEEILLTSSR